MTIADVELTISRRVDGTATVGMRLELPNQRVDLVRSAPVTITDQVLTALTNNPDVYGATLTAMVFPYPLREAWGKACAYADSRGEALRVRLTLEGDDNLQAIRWELLRDPLNSTPLAHNERRLLSRFLPTVDFYPLQLPAQPELRAVVAVANPPSLPSEMQQVNVAGEVARARQGLGETLMTVLDGLDDRPTATLPAIAAALRDGAHILYLVCHGSLIDGQPRLWLERVGNEHYTPVSGNDLVETIANLQRRPLLIVLASCQSGGDNYQLLTAIGPKLAQAGIGAVIAMQGDVPVELVAQLTPKLFTELQRDGLIDRALTAARTALPSSQPWWIPALWIAVKDGCLWRTEKDSPRSPTIFKPGILIGGRYVLQRPLGSGRFSETYLAYDQRSTQHLCVLKRQRLPIGLDDSELRLRLQQLSHEANLLAGLNTPGHPNIPVIFDYLPDEHCLVMKYIEGRDLGAVLANNSQPLVPSVALRYARDTCSALVYLHGRNPAILHQDVKLANILLDATDRAWLVDLGFSTSDNTINGETGGYAPLEQRSSETGPRSDVFALGIALFQLLTGVKQFDIEVAQAISHGQTSVLPPPEQLNPRVDRATSELVRRCIAPDPQDRPDSIALLAALDRLINHLSVPEAFRPDPLPNTRLFIGREGELTQLMEHVSGEHLAAIIGIAGVGKTTLAVALASRIGSQEDIFWHRLLPGQGADRLMRTLAAFIAYHGDTALLHLLAERVPDLPLQTAFTNIEHPSNPHRLTFERCCDYLVNALLSHNYVLVLDDIHIDTENEQLQILCARLSDIARSGEITLIVTGRSVPPWLSPYKCVMLRGLANVDAYTLLHSYNLMLAQEHLDKIIALTEGNTQLLHLIANRLRAHTEPKPILENLLSGDIYTYLVDEVYAQLTPVEQGVINAVAILGEEGATRAAIEFLTEIDDCSAAISSLARRYLLESAGSSLSAMQYTLHASLSPACLSQISEVRAQVLHQRAAIFFSQASLQPLRSAGHFLAAGQASDAASLAVERFSEIINTGQGRALAKLFEGIDPRRMDVNLRRHIFTARGELAALHGSYAVAKRWIQQAVEAEGDTSNGPASPAREQVRRQRLLASFSQRLGEYQGAEEICREAIKTSIVLPERDIERAGLHIELATALWRQGRLSEALECCLDGHLAVPIGPDGDYSRLLLWYIEAAIAIDQGHYDEALAQLEHGLALAGSIGDKTLQAYLSEKHGYANYRRGNIDDARVSYARSLELRQVLGDVVGEIAALNDLATLDWSEGDWQAAQRSFETLIDRCRRLRLRPHEATARLNLGQMLLEYRQIVTSKSQLEQALTSYRRINDDIGIAHCHYLLGDIALLQNDPERAFREGQAALEHAPVEESPSYAACALRVMGAACMAQGRSADANAYFVQAWEAHAEVEDTYDKAWILAGWAETTMALGDAMLAKERASQALELAEEQHIVPVIARMQELLAHLERGRSEGLGG